MIPDFDSHGNLPPGRHVAVWREIVDRFGFTPYRMRLVVGLRTACDALRYAGCATLYLNGSFTSARRVPGDFDGCWDTVGVDIAKLDPVLKLFANGRAAQKAKYLGELFPASFVELGSGKTFLEFFQTDKNTGDAKGILQLDLRSLT